MTFAFNPARPLWLLGCGNMAGALLERWIEAGLDPAAVTVIDPGPTAVSPGVRLLAAAPDEPPPAVLLLGIKPQLFENAASPSLAGTGTVIVSIMAGIDGAALSARFGRASGIVRLMPNLAVRLGKGVALLHRARGEAAVAELAEALAAPLGLSLWVEDEALIDAGTAVSGSGPAFALRFIDAMARGAQALGFAPDEAARLALATVEGAAALAAASGEPPAALAERVASPGGTTRAGLDVLDAELPLLVERTLRAARDRAEALKR